MRDDQRSKGKVGRGSGKRIPTPGFNPVALNPYEPLSNLYREILDHVGALEEPEFLDVQNTPPRVARMLLDELLGSYRPEALQDLKRRFTTFPVNGAEEMVTLGSIPFVSLCAHHMLPFVGEAFVGYLPGDRLVGLSKIPRVVKFFSRKLQMQERLTKEIADFLSDELKPQGVIVVMKARHFCMEARGVETAGVVTSTSALRGVAMTDKDIRKEFYQLLDSKG